MTFHAMVLDNTTSVDWGAFEKSLVRRFGVNAVSLNADGSRRTPEPGGAVNGICRLIRSDAGGLEKICSKFQRRLNRAAAHRKTGVVGECPAGMIKIVVPVLVDDRVEGFVSVCGRPYYSQDRIYTDAVARILGEDEARIRLLLSTLAPIDAKTMKAISRHLSSLCGAHCRAIHG